METCSFLPTNFKGYLAWKGTFAQPPQKDKKAARKEEKESAKAQATEERVVIPLARFSDGDFGDLAMVQSAFKTDRIWTNPVELSAGRVGEKIWTRCRVHSSRTKGKMTWILLRKGVASVQGLVMASDDVPRSKEMVVYASKIPKESVIDVFGEVTAVPTPVTSATQSDIEIRVLKIYVVSASIPELPFQLEDASKTEPTHAGCGLEYSEDADRTKGVGQDLRLNNRWLDLRTNANQGIFKISSAVCTFFRSFFLENGFVEIHSPKIIPGTSEGGSEIFRLNYFGRPACLAQSPQLYKQMGVMSDLCNVFEIGPVFRAENSNTPRHMCEFVGMDFEMEIKEHYHEILLNLGNLFVHIFDNINKYCQPELAAIHRQYPFRPLRYRPKNQTLVLDFRDIVKMLNENGEKMEPTADLTTPQEKKLGVLVGAKYGTDFYIVDKYPAAVRPFYTMPCPHDKRYSNSYDAFLRGEEITSGAQRVHDVDLLTRRATECNIPLESLAKYISSFSMGAFPHGGAGIGLERVVMLFLGLDTIKKSSMFPRTPARCEP